MGVLFNPVVFKTQNGLHFNEVCALCKVLHSKSAGAMSEQQGLRA